jgi:regulation of enolase protein 1 (concanavalin A-like superfamily)
MLLGLAGIAELTFMEARGKVYRLPANSRARLMVRSDDFYGGLLDPIWRIEGPSGTSWGLGTSGDEAYLTLATGTGNHDIWGTNRSSRALQSVADEDMSLEVRFLTTPAESYEMQGILVEQDAQNWIRFDTYSDGSTLYAFAAVTQGGSSAQKFKVVIPGGSAPYLRVDRAGDVWTMSYSTDGVDWAEAGSFTQALMVTSVGPFAGSTPGSGGFTTEVDYFESAADPLATEDGITIPNQMPAAVDDTLQTDVNTDLTVSAADLLANDSDGDGDALSVTGLGDPASGTLVNNGDGTWTYTPEADFTGTDSFTYTVTDGKDTATATVTVGALPPPGPPQSDDFYEGQIHPAWWFEGPAGTSTNLGSNADESFLALVTPDGNYDIWGENNAARIMQRVEDTNFQLETRFLTTPSEAYQMQGLLIEADADTWIRFDTVSNGGGLRAFAAVTVDGTSVTRISEPIPGTAAPYLRVTRSGDEWTFSYSKDGSVWTEAGRFAHALNVSSVGVFAANTGPAAGYTALVDYFENTADPLGSEDGEFAQDDSISLRADSIAVIDVAADLLANDSVPGTEPLSLASFTQPDHGILDFGTDGTITYMPDAGYAGSDSFTYTVTDGYVTDTATVAITISAPAASDDFSGGPLAPVWSFAGIDGFAQVATNATDGFLEIHSPAGVVVSASDVLTTPRVLQSVPDEDFQISAGFLTEPTEKYQEHGLLVVQDSSNWIRFDLAFTGSTTTLIVGMIEDGSTSYPLFKSMGSGVANHLRITRTGDIWSFEYSTDGTTWTQAYSTTRALTVTQTGLFAGSNSFDSEPPGYVARVDYFENSLLPIADEDGTIVPTNVRPIAADDFLFTDEDTPRVIDVAADLMINDSDSNDDPLTVVSFTEPAQGVLVESGNGALTYTPNSGYRGADRFTYTISDGTETDTATVEIFVGDPIFVWYGPEQTFGARGEAQEWVNILGKVVGEVSSLTYTLNGGAPRELSTGADTRRLQNDGDFNIDISYAELDPTSSDDIVRITAVMSSGETSTAEVFIDYQAGAVWDADYTINWGEVSNIQDAVQVVDGLWTISDGGLRPAELGYDRVVALGDASWDNYEVRLSITTHDLLNTDPRGRDGGGFALGMLWNGHTDNPISGLQPKSGWEPGAAFFYTDNNADGSGWLTLHPSIDFFDNLGQLPLTLQEGATYEVLLRTESVGVFDRQYSLKIWEQGAAEPSAWTMQGTQTFSATEAPATGSLYLNAHYFDVAFGDVTATEIRGSDTVPGRESSDNIVAVDLGDLLPGQAEIDILMGGGGADTFVLGADGTCYYDDGVVGSAGQEDFCLVWDFDVGTDRIRLAGNASDYVLSDGPDSLEVQGTAIWKTDPSGDDELVGLLRNIYGLSLEDGDFVYDLLA